MAVATFYGGLLSKLPGTTGTVSINAQLSHFECYIIYQASLLEHIQ